MSVLLGILLMSCWRSEAAAERIYNAFAPALSFINHYMAMFYAPLLVTLPQNASSLIGVPCPAVSTTSGAHLWAGSCPCPCQGQSWSSLRLIACHNHKDGPGRIFIESSCSQIAVRVTAVRGYEQVRCYHASYCCWYAVSQHRFLSPATLSPSFGSRPCKAETRKLQQLCRLQPRHSESGPARMSRAPRNVGMLDTHPQRTSTHQSSRPAGVDIAPPIPFAERCICVVLV